MKFLQLSRYSLIFCCIVVFLPLLSWAGEFPNPEKWAPTIEQSMKAKKGLDDPTDLSKTMPLKKVIPAEILNLLSTDVKAMQRETAEINGFKAPDVVGKVAPEIKPGKYTYKDLEKYPGLKTLLLPNWARMFKKAGPPLAGGIEELIIEPTQQFYWPLALITQSKKSAGKAKQDSAGYMIEGTLATGFPFPVPSGPHKAQQIIYNMLTLPAMWDDNYRGPVLSMGFDRKLNMDSETYLMTDKMKLGGRSLFPPYGWYDERAKKQNEYSALLYNILAPRSQRGMNVLIYNYSADSDKLNQSMLNVPSLRRVRKLSSTDTQDVAPGGSDCIYDDNSFLGQKISRTVYPYEYKVEEREYLVPISTHADQYIDSRNSYCLRNVRFQRRPVYVVEMKQLDKGYVYGKRIYYIDKETFTPVCGEFFDQRGRLYRTYDVLWMYWPEYGQVGLYGSFQVNRDMIDQHTTLQLIVLFPAIWDRNHLTVETMVRYAK